MKEKLWKLDQFLLKWVGPITLASYALMVIVSAVTIVLTGFTGDCAPMTWGGGVFMIFLVVIIPVLGGYLTWGDRPRGFHTETLILVLFLGLDGLMLLLTVTAVLDNMGGGL